MRQIVAEDRVGRWRVLDLGKIVQRCFEWRFHPVRQRAQVIVTGQLKTRIKECRFRSVIPQSSLIQGDAVVVALDFLWGDFNEIYLNFGKNIDRLFAHR